MPLFQQETRQEDAEESPHRSAQEADEPVANPPEDGPFLDLRGLDLQAVFLEVGEEDFRVFPADPFVVQDRDHLIVQEQAQVVHIGRSEDYEIVVAQVQLRVHRVFLPLVDADAGRQEAVVHGLRHALFRAHVVDARHDPADVHAAAGRLLQGLDGGLRRRRIGIVEPEILLGVPDGPFEAVPDGKLAVRRRIRDDLHGHVEVLRFPRDGVRPGGRGEVRVHVRVLGPGRHEPLLAAVGPGQVGHDGRGPGPRTGPRPGAPRAAAGGGRPGSGRPRRGR